MTGGERRVVGIRRYPVKSMGGEDLDEVVVDDRGLVGDRWFAVVDADGGLASGKTTRRFRRRDEVFGFRAWTTPDGVRVARATTGADDQGWAVDDPDLDQVLAVAMDAPVRVRPEDATPHQDAGAVSLVGTATLDWMASRLDLDAARHRIRVNLVVATQEPFEEEAWAGTTIHLGPVALDVVERIPRCRMIGLAQDGAATPAPALRRLVSARGEPLVGLYADVAMPGTVHVGDALREAPDRAGGRPASATLDDAAEAVSTIRDAR